MPNYRVVYLDAFTQVPFTGNPCAVLPQATGLTDEQMQSVAREVNLPESAFVFPSSQADFRVRYFMPHAEIPFAGHPTIATAFLLAQDGAISLREPVTEITFEFNIGVLPVEIHVQNRRPAQVVMTQQLPNFGPTFPASEVAPCFSLTTSDLRPDCPPQVVSTGVPFLIVPVTDLGVLESVKMKRDLLTDLCQRAGVSAAFMFCLSGFSLEADTHARLFDPQSAIEDPFTGSATGAMGAYVIHYGMKPGPRLVAEQGHFVGRPGRGVLEVQHSGMEITAVKLGGPAVQVLEGHFIVDNLSNDCL